VRHVGLAVDHVRSRLERTIARGTPVGDGDLRVLLAVADGHRQAIEQGVIPESLAGDLPKAVESYIRASGRAMLTAQPAIGPSPLEIIGS